jgi:hypothetical protein
VAVAGVRLGWFGLVWFGLISASRPRRKRRKEDRENYFGIVVGVLPDRMDGWMKSGKEEYFLLA